MKIFDDQETKPRTLDKVKNIYIGRLKAATSATPRNAP